MDVDKYSKEQAEEYADNEAEMLGFAKGSLKWKSKYSEYIEFAKGTMSVGRNPRNMRNPILQLVPYYSDILSANGLAGRLARNYQSSESRGVPVEAIQNRIMSSVTNLVKLFENAELGTKTTTSGRNQGKIENSNMSEMQMPTKSKDMSDTEYEKLMYAVVKRQMTRDLLTNILLESLIPFFELKRKDIDDLMATFNFKMATPEELRKQEWKKSWIEALRGVIGKKFSSMNYRKILFGD